ASIRAIAGDVTDPQHRGDLAAAVATTGRLDLLVNNASALGPSPRPALRDAPIDELRRVHEVNVLAPLALIQATLEVLTASNGAVIDVTSDVSIEPVAGWGVYATSKAALDHLTAILAAEQPALDVYALDPGDLRTAMHQAAFPDEDISDRPSPESAVPAILALLDQRPPSGRYRASELPVPAGGAA
ncbi:MAG: SDR family NAD(P)-dependent oxidoreductase, partial [Actinomycetota bacterium]